MRVTHVCPFMGERMGGSERYVVNLSQIQSEEMDVHIYTTTEFYQRVGITKIRNITIHRFYSPLVIWEVNPLSFILKSLMKDNADILHIHSYLYFISNQAILAKILKKKPSLLQLHGGIGLPPHKTSWIKLSAKHIYDKTLGSFTIKNSDFLASVSHSDIEYISSEFNIPKSRLYYIPNAVDTNIFSYTNKKHENRTKVLLYVGDLEEWKGISSLIRWISRNDGWENDIITIKFVGQGTYYSQLLNLQEKQRKQKSRIQLDVMGPRKHSEIPALMKSADALILPSYWEGVPTVILEAMSSGIPVIATPVGDIPKLLVNMKTGLLIERDFESFQNAVRIALSGDSLIERIVKNARELIEKEFSIEKVTENVMRVYDLI